MTKNAALILVGKLGAPHGVRGQMRLKSYTGEPLAVTSYGLLQLKTGQKIEISHARLLKDDMLVASLTGVGTREDAANLSGQDLYLPRSALPPASENEFYHADLVGLVALDIAGKKIGHVSAIHNFGAGDILEIAVQDRGAEPLLLPFTKAVVPVVDFNVGIVTIAPPREIEIPETHVPI